MGLSVLVVDDSEFFRETITDVLEGIDDVNVVGTAENGQVAINKVTLLHPDLVTLDIEMPVMDGIEALTQIKQQCPETIIVMISSATKEEAAITIKALTLGAFDFIEKPDEGDHVSNERYLRYQLTRVTDTILSQKG